MREADELARVAVHVGATVEHEDRLARAGKERSDRGPLHPGVQAQQQRARRQHGAGVAGGDEGIGLALLLQVETNRDGGARIAARGLSPMPTTSGASTTSMRARSAAPLRPSAASMSALRPTSWIWNSAGNSLSASAAPSTS